VNVLVTFHRHPDRVELEVSDDGVGFDPAVTFVSERSPGAVRTDRGFGLPAARARLRECGGDLDVSSAPGRGTRIRASVFARSRPRPVEPSFTPATAR
jgi:signal transduction histidine kinase